jgi:hypothetical protein
MLAFLQVHEHHLQRQSKSSSAPSLSSDQSQRHSLVATVFSRIECSHCHRRGHTADKCFSLHPELRPSSSTQFQSNSLPGPPSRSSLSCSHCQRSGHTKEQCYQLIGYPKRDSYGSRERSRSPSASRQGARTNHVNMPTTREATPFSLTQD